jgi:hypothetical protein
MLEAKGDIVLVGYLQTAAINVYDAAGGTFVGILIPGSIAGSSSGWLDETNGLTAHQIGTSIYDVFAEENLHDKVLLYHVSVTH